MTRVRELLTRVTSALLTFGILAYRVALSPVLGPSCRFAPSCSQYALDAIRLHGPVAGSWLALKRIARCHPLHPGGVDPVPTRGERLGS